MGLRERRGAGRCAAELEGRDRATACMPAVCTCAWRVAPQLLHYDRRKIETALEGARREAERAVAAQRPT